jgi:hypothetical protein
MSKQAEDNATEAVAGKVAAAGFELTPAMLAMIGAAVASAVKESKRDAKVEAQEARTEAEREQVRKEELQRIANMEARQNACPHLDTYENYAFCGQKNCLGQIVFICSQCCKPFRPGEPDYNNFVRFVKWDKLGNARA